jgi:Short repeat of unknown function (DUF308)
VIAESEFADHQISRIAAGRSPTSGTLSSVRCWPAKLASALSSSTADERTASGPASGRAAAMSCSMARCCPAATALTIEPDSAIPGGTGSPLRTAAGRRVRVDGDAGEVTVYPWGFTLTVGVIELLLGVWAMRRPEVTLALLITIIGLWAVVTGVIYCVLAFEIRRTVERPGSAADGTKREVA